MGTILALMVVIFVFMIIGMSSTPTTTIVTGSTLHVKLDHPVPELTDNMAGSEFSFEPVDFTGLNDIKKAISKAANDNKISSLLIQTEFPLLGQATALSLYTALEEFKDSGKPIFAYGEYFSQAGYMMASIADTVILNPNGMMDIRGFGMLIPYFAEMLENIDAKVDVYFAGQYKSAIEPFYRRQSSPQNDYQSKEFLTDFQDEWLDNVTAYRSVKRDDILSIINEGTLVTAELAEELKLVDKLMYWEDFEVMLEEVVDRKPKLVDVSEYISTGLPESSSSSDNRIAVIYMEGEIRNNVKTKGMISMDRYEKVFDRLVKNNKVKAVVLRVNSPGGDALESDIIWDRVEQLKNAGKYVVASFGDYAASGGYYVACGADEIVTQPNTLTGSIGVFAMIPDLSQTMKKQLGINFDSIGTGENTFIYSPMVPRTKEQNAKIQVNTEQTYARFLSRVAEGRDMSVEEVDKVAQGRVWSGTDAVGVGLADEVGDLDRAIELAAEGAGIESYKTLQYPVIKKNIYEQILQDIMAMEEVQILTGAKKEVLLKKEIESILYLLSNKEISRPQTRLPFMIMEQ